MSEIDLKIVREINYALSLLGAKSDLLGTVGSWKDCLPDEDVLAGLKAWNEWKRNELSERLSLGSADNSTYSTVYDNMSNETRPLKQPAVSCWVYFDWNKIETRPTKYGKYLICRKDGKIHWETWNGSGWAYNHNEIRYWAVIVPPCS